MMPLDNCDRIEVEEFLDKYEPINISESGFFQSLKNISSEFYDECIQVQDDIINGRLDENGYEDESEFVAGGINAEILEKIGGYWNFGEFVRNYLFQVRQEWIDATPRGAALKELETQNSTLDELFQIYIISLGDKVVGGASVSDEGITQLKNFISQKGNQFPQAVGAYLSEISNLSGNIFLSKLISFLKEYRIKVGIDDTKRDFHRVVVGKVAA